jgi:hypothetical protein
VREEVLRLVHQPLKTILVAIRDRALEKQLNLGEWPEVVADAPRIVR